MPHALRQRSLLVCWCWYDLQHVMLSGQCSEARPAEGAQMIGSTWPMGLFELTLGGLYACGC